MLHVVAFLPDSRAGKRLTSALALREPAGRTGISFVSGWVEARTLALVGAPEMLVFDPYATGRFDGESFAAFAGQFPSCVLFGYGTFPCGCARDVLDLGHGGVGGVATQDVDDAPHALALLLDRALENGGMAKALSLLERRMPPSLRDRLPRLLFEATESLTPRQVARRCHRHPKTLCAQLRSAGLPPLGKLIVWTRLIRACHFLQDAERSVENVALVLGFASANSFRNQLLRYAGVRPTDLRRTGEIQSLLLRFEATLGSPA